MTTATPYIIEVTAQAKVSVLIWADSPESASDIADHEAYDLSEKLRITAGLPDVDHPSAPFVTYDHDVRPALFEEAHGPNGLSAGVPKFHACDCCITEDIAPPTTPTDESEPTA